MGYSLLDANHNSSIACALDDGYDDEGSTGAATGCATNYYESVASRECAECSAGFVLAAAAFSGTATECIDVPTGRR